MAKNKATKDGKKSSNKKTSSKTSSREEIAISGKKTKGTQIGDPREITAADIADANLIEASVIDDIERVDGYELGDAERISAYELGDAETVDDINIDTSKADEFRGMQMDLARQLEAQTRGEGPSLANLQFKDATQRNISEQLALAFSGQGPNGALAQRTAAMNIGGINQEAALKSAQLRMAEQLQAQTALGTLTGQARGQDLNTATAQAQIALETALANQAEKNKFQLAQGEFTQQANIANQQAANQFQLAQGEFTQQANIANQVAANARAAEQARLEQAAAQGNQQAINQLAAQQAQLNQQAAIANQAAWNSTQQAQADINTRLQQSRMSAAASQASAAAGASASRYATDAGLYKFNQELAFEMDKYYQGQGRADINDVYDSNRQGVQDESKIRDDQFGAVGNAGGALAGTTTKGPANVGATK